MLWQPDYFGDPDVYPEQVIVEVESAVEAVGQSYSLWNGVGADLDPAPNRSYGKVTYVRAGGQTVSLGSIATQSTAYSGGTGFCFANTIVTVKPHEVRMVMLGLLPSDYYGACLVGQVILPGIEVDPPFAPSPQDTGHWKIGDETGPFDGFVHSVQLGQLDAELDSEGLSTQVAHSKEGTASYYGEFHLGTPGVDLELNGSHSVEAPSYESFYLPEHGHSVSFQDPQSGLWGIVLIESSPDPDIGIYFRGRVTTPVQYTELPFVGFGVWEFVQIVSPFAIRSHFNGSKEKLNWNGQSGLDSFLPYPFLVGNGLGTGIANGEWCLTRDTPMLGGLPNTVNQINVDHHFQMKTLYWPPNTWRLTGTLPVPLAWVKWNWTGEARRVATGTPLLVIGDQERTDADDMPADVHPTWTQLITGEATVWQPDN